MRRLIPYIASNFQNDRIWLRRSKPSKRDYQVLLAVDDSSSMCDNRCSQVQSRGHQCCEYSCHVYADGIRISSTDQYSSSSSRLWATRCLQVSGVAVIIITLHCVLLCGRFGEGVEVLHSLDQPFSSSSGSSILQHLSFSQGKTNFVQVLHKSKFNIVIHDRSILCTTVVATDGRSHFQSLSSPRKAVYHRHQPAATGSL